MSLVISVCGGSGAGKSLLSRKLAELLPNSLLINGDLYMHQISKAQEEKILANIGKKKNNNVFSYNYYLETFDNVKVWIQTIEKEMADSISAEIEKNDGQKDFIIIDWCFSPLCKWFNKFDATVCVTADYKTKYNRLVKRLSNPSICSYGDGAFTDYSPEIIVNRLKYTSLDELGYASNIYINNNFDLESYDSQIEQLKNELLKRAARKELESDAYKFISFEKKQPQEI